MANISEKYGDLRFGGGIQAGARNSHDYFVSQTALYYQYKKFWMLAELANADGSNGASGLTKKKSWGYNVTLAYRLTKKLEFLLRYDDFEIEHNNSREYTAGINYYILGQTLRLALNYIFCQQDAKSDTHKIILGSQILF